MAYYYDSKAEILYVSNLGFGDLIIDSEWFSTVTEYVNENLPGEVNQSSLIDSDFGIYRKEMTVFSPVSFHFTTIKGSGKFTIQATEVQESGSVKRHIMEMLVTSDSNESICTTYASLSTSENLFDVDVESFNDSETKIIITPHTSSIKKYKMAGMVL